MDRTRNDQFNGKLHLGTGTLQHPHLRPRAHFQLGRILLVYMQHLQVFQFLWRATRSGNFLSILSPNHSLEIRVIRSHVVVERTLSATIAGIECFRLQDEVERLQVPENHHHRRPATLLSVVLLALGVMRLTRVQSICVGFQHPGSLAS